MSHNIPPNDGFDYSSAQNYGTALNMYFRVRPHSSTASDPAAETSTGYGIVFAQGDLYDGYQLSGVNGCGFVQHSSVTSAPCITGSAWRRQHFASGDVSIQPRMHVVSGGVNDDSFRCTGVFGRFRNSTLAVPTGANQTEEFFRTGGCYAFLQLNKTGLGMRFKLLRFNLGVITELGDAAGFNGYASPAHAGANLYGPAPFLRMTIVNDGSNNPQIVCYARRYFVIAGGEGEGGGLTFTDQIIFNVIDSSGSALRLGGYWGFFGQPMRDQSGVGQSGVLVDLFTGLNSDVGGFFFEDQFIRRDRFAARTRVDALSRSGRSLMCGWSGDIHGTQDSGRNHFFHLLRDAAVQKIQCGGPNALGTGQASGWFLSQRAATIPHSAARSIIFNSANADTSIDRRHGIALRMSLTGSQPDYRGGQFSKRTGYMLVVKYASPGSPTWSLEWWHFNGNTSPTAQPTVLATADLTAFGLALGTDFTLLFEAQNAGASPFGTPVLLAKVNGTAVTPTGNIPGTQVVDDYLFDMRSTATKGGFGEGFYFHPDTAGAAQLCTIDTWLEENLTIPPEAGDQDHESVVMPAETAGKTGTLEVPLSWPIRELGEHYSVRKTAELGHRYVRLRYPKKRRTWRVGARGVTTAERQSLLTFFDGHDGVVVPFDWTVPISGESVAVHFRTPTLRSALVQPSIESFDFELEEVFDH